MVKTILAGFISFFLISTNSDKPLVRNNPQASETGTLEKMIVANGTVAMDIDLNRKKSSLKFEATPNSFFTVLVFNDELRGLERGSMTLIPQAEANLPAPLSASYRQLTVDSTAWGEPYELVVRDAKTAFVFFNVEGHQYDYTPSQKSLAINKGRLLLSKEFAAALGRPSAVGSVVGNISISANMRPIEITQVVNGDPMSSVMPPMEPSAGTVPGPDVIVGDLNGLAQFGSSSGTQVGLAVGTDSCNAGVVPLNWLALPANDHPVIPQNLYRMSGGTSNSDRFEQIGQSNVKHAFTALQQNICGFGCNATASTTLGSGCSDPYVASLNAGNNNALGSRAWINPFTGAYPRGDSATPPNTHTGHTHTGPSHRIVVEMNDLNTTLNPGATYFAEAQYVTPHEYAWCQAHAGECNMGNNASYRQYSVTGTTSYTFNPVAATVRTKPAIVAWTGATVKDFQPDPGNDGIAYVGYKVTNPSPGVWHYEYVLYNQNLDRGMQSFTVPLGPGTTITNIGFHGPPQHPGWTFDGTVGNTGYSSAPWTVTQTSTSLTWNSETFAQNPNANAIRWGTLYNFRFDADRPPQSNSATIGFFKTGAPMLASVQSPELAPPLPGISISDVTITEGNAGTKQATFNVNLSASSTDTVTVQYATADGTAASPSDYASASGTVTFVPTDTSETVSITLNGDTVEEFNETFFVNLTNPTNANIDDAQGLGTITNDDVLASLPGGFAETQIAGLSNPTAMAIHPDGRVFVCQQTGALRVIKNGALLATPFTTLTVNSSGERGLLGIAFDPNYATNHFIYVYYTATTPAIHNRVSRFTADIANEDIAVVGSELPILDLENLGATNHNGGAIHFGPDGKLYVAVGENANSGNSQLLTNRLGKMLRINSDGSLPADNPTTFPNIAGSTSGLNRAIWAVGLRNPFTFNFQPGTGRMHINDVGQSAWEEVNLGVAGANYGWGGGCEGTCAVAGMTNPIYQYANDASTCAIAGGAFYNPTTPTFPAEYLGKYFIADLCGGWLKTLDPLNPPATSAAPSFATGISSPVDIQVANDGSLYYLARGTNSVFRVQYFGGSTLAINDVSVNEGNTGVTIANLTLVLSPASAQTVTVNYATANNTAVEPSDYQSRSGTVTFLPGEISKDVPMTVNGDTGFEPNESFNVNLTLPSNATIGDNQGVLTIQNDDSQPTISIGDTAVTEGNSGTVTAAFTVSLSNTSTQNVTVNYATANDTATSGSDYVATSGTATITAGQLTTTVNVTVNGDTTFEGNEFFLVNLTSPTNATISDNQATGVINNDDAQPTISLSVNDVSHNEGQAGTTDYDFIVTLSNPSAQTVTVNAATADDSATTADSDYTGVPSTLLTFAPSDTTKHFHVLVNGDTKFEVNEQFFVNLSGQTNATLAGAQGVGTITNDDTEPTISINNTSVTEGNAGTIPAAFTVTLSNPSYQFVTVNYLTSDGTATSGSDYVTQSNTVTFAPGVLTQPLSVTVNGETAFEPDETFNVNLVAPVHATIADNLGVATITNDDTQPTISINDVSVNEGNAAGSVTAGFTVSLTNASSQTITVNYATADGTATAGNEYVSASGTLTFNPGQLTQPINVTVNGDLLNENSVAFNVNLTTPANATITDNQGVATISDDDAPVLATEENSQRAVALDAVTFVRDPFAVTNLNYFGADKRTRISLFATNLSVTPGLVVTAQAVDGQQGIHPMIVESVGLLPNSAGHTQIIVRLPDGITNAGDLQMSITVRGKASNSVLVGVIP
jgi:glucose/arabinose dehydrogenase